MAIQCPIWYPVLQSRHGLRPGGSDEIEAELIRPSGRRAAGRTSAKPRKGPRNRRTLASGAGKNVYPTARGHDRTRAVANSDDAGRPRPDVHGVLPRPRGRYPDQRGAGVGDLARDRRSARRADLGCRKPRARRGSASARPPAPSPERGGLATAPSPPQTWASSSTPGTRSPRFGASATSERCGSSSTPRNQIRKVRHEAAQSPRNHRTLTPAGGENLRSALEFTWSAAAVMTRHQAESFTRHRRRRAFARRAGPTSSGPQCHPPPFDSGWLLDHRMALSSAPLSLKAFTHQMSVDHSYYQLDVV